MDNSILINNVQIFDGSSEQTDRGNVLVVNSRIKTVSDPYGRNSQCYHS